MKRHLVSTSGIFQAIVWQVLVSKCNSTVFESGVDLKLKNKTVEFKWSWFSILIT